MFEIFEQQRWTTQTPMGLDGEDDPLQTDGDKPLAENKRWTDGDEPSVEGKLFWLRIKDNEPIFWFMLLLGMWVQTMSYIN